MKKLDYATLFTLRSDGRYQGSYKDSSGNRCYVYDRDPEKLYKKIEEKKNSTHATFKEMAEGWEKKRREDIKDRTWKNYKPHYDELVGLYGDTPIDTVTAADVDADLKRAKAKGYSKTVVNTRKVVWSGIFDYALAYNKIKYNPAMSVKLPKGLKHGKRKAPDDDMVTSIIKSADDMQFGFIPFFLLCTGLRRTEALTAMKKDVDLKNWEIHIPISKTENGIRDVPIIQPLREPLRAWMDAHPGPWVFPYMAYNGRHGTHMSDSNWETAWLAYCTERGWLDEEGRPSIGAHNLRHGTATLLFESGVDVYTAKDILGHANVTTTMEIYTELRDAQAKKSVRKFSQSMSKRMSNSKK